MKESVLRLRFAWHMRIFGVCLLCLATRGISSDAAEPLGYRLKWIFNASVLGDIYADVHGFFREEDLQVAVKPGGPERDAILELELGRAAFGVASADQVIRAASKGARLAVLAQWFQIKPLQWMYRPDRMQIQTLRDLKGHRLGVTFGGNDESILKTLLAMADLAESDVAFFSVRNDFSPFLRKKIHFWPVYRNTQAVFLEARLKAEGESIAFFNPAEYGVKFVANSVITSERFLREHPKIVQRFMKALIGGWQAAMDLKNQARAFETLKRIDKESPPDLLKQQIELTRALVHPNPAVPIGTIDVEAWQQTETIMLRQNQIPMRVNIEHALRPMLPAVGDVQRIKP